MGLKCSAKRAKRRSPNLDLILTNKKRSFTGSSTVETGLSNFHVMIVTVLKGGFVKKGPKTVYYRDFSKYDNKAFKRDHRGPRKLYNPPPPNDKEAFL